MNVLMPLLLVALYGVLQVRAYRTWQNGWRTASILPVLIFAGSICIGVWRNVVRWQHLEYSSHSTLEYVSASLFMGCWLSIITLCILSLSQRVIGKPPRPVATIAGLAIIAVSAIIAVVEFICWMTIEIAQLGGCTIGIPPRQAFPQVSQHALRVPDSSVTNGMYSIAIYQPDGRFEYSGGGIPISSSRGFHGINIAANGDCFVIDGATYSPGQAYKQERRRTALAMWLVPISGIRLKHKGFFTEAIVENWTSQCTTNSRETILSQARAIESERQSRGFIRDSDDDQGGLTDAQLQAAIDDNGRRLRIGVIGVEIDYYERFGFPWPAVAAVSLGACLILWSRRKVMLNKCSHHIDGLRRRGGGG